MKTLSALVATAAFALTAPVEAGAPAPAETAAAAECPPGFHLRTLLDAYPNTPIMVGPGDVDGDGYYCAMVLGAVTILIDNKR